MSSEIGRKIRQARKKVGLKQWELAKKIGVSESRISQYENGTQNPRVDTLQKIAEGLGITPVDIIGMEWFDMQLGPEKLEELREASKDSSIDSYLKSLGFTVNYLPIKCHDEEVDDSGHIASIPDEWGTVLSKDGHTATFTKIEFEELQAGAKEAIEGRFYKKVLKQQKK